MLLSPLNHHCTATLPFCNEGSISDLLNRADETQLVVHQTFSLLLSVYPVCENTPRGIGLYKITHHLPYAKPVMAHNRS